MRTVQYRDATGRRGTVILRGSGEPAIDVTAAIGGLGNVATLIGRSRATGTSLAVLAADLAAHPSAQPVELDFSAALNGDSAAGFSLDLPVDAPEVWAAGVSYQRSREARELESGPGSAIYAKVYQADRPELFLKDAGCRRTVASGDQIGIRPDSEWNVPEPELALVLDAEGRIVGYTIGNDVSSRTIEAENPLYLPQAKIYANSCALGPAMLLADGSSPTEFEIRLRVYSERVLAYEGETSTRTMKRSFSELIHYLTRANPIADATVLLTGTGIVPHEEFTLREGDLVEIEVPGIGVLHNRVGPLPNEPQPTTTDGVA